jgi:tetratricopeptide (TPR) repeat protein
LFLKKNNKVFFGFKLAAAIILAAFLSSCGYSDDLHMRHHQLGMFWNYRFQELETSLDEQLNLYKNRKLTGAQLSKQIFSLEWANQGADKRFAGYVEAMPNSKWSHLLYGLYLVKQASDARGSETYNKTPQANFEKMTQLAEQAKALLETAHRHQAPFGLYAGGILKANLLLNVDDENKSLVDEAMARDGDIWRAPFSYFQSLYPQWGGSESAMLAFIEEVKPKNAKLAKALQADFYWRSGRHFEVSGQLDAATAEYTKAISFDAHSDALTDLGAIYMRAGKCDAAVDLFERNLEENDEWDLYTLEVLMQAHDCAGNSWQFSRVRAKRSELFTRYSAGE